MKFHSNYIFGFLIVFIFLVSTVSVSGFDSRPPWLLSQNDMSTKFWPMDVDYKNGNSWYVGFNAPNGGFISIEPLQFSSSSAAINQVSQANATALAVQKAGSLIYSFPNFRFDLNTTSSGFAWEVLSPCCYSRGVAFSFKNVYIHIFGSQATKWPDMVYAFDKQVVKLENYYNMPVSTSLSQAIAQYERNYISTSQNSNLVEISGFALIVVLPVIAIAIVAYSPIKRRFKKQ